MLKSKQKILVLCIPKFNVFFLIYEHFSSSICPQISVPCAESHTVRVHAGSAGSRNANALTIIQSVSTRPLTKRASFYCLPPPLPLPSSLKLFRKATCDFSCTVCVLVLTVVITLPIKTFEKD